MIVDAHDLRSRKTLQADLCIVGAGAAGIAIALQFAASGLDILLLESGGLQPDSSSQALCAGEVVDPALHPPADMFRRRGLGGSTTLWGGRCAPLDPVDFARRPWLHLPSAWPIGYADLLPYWQRACRLAEIGAFDFQASSAVAGGMRPMIAGFADAAVSTDRIERFSPPTNFAATYGGLLRQSRHITVLLHATCRQLALTPDRRAVSHLDIACARGGSLAVHPRIVVLATGGIEIPRLLLASDTQIPNGIGNTHGQVGRHYMCHLAGTTGVVTPAAGPIPFHGYERARDGVYCRRRFSIESWAQQAVGIGNAVARLHHPRIADPTHRSAPLSGLYLGRQILPAEYTRRMAAGARPSPIAHALNVARDPGSAAAFAWSMLRGRAYPGRKYPSVTVVPKSGLFTLDVHAEQLPNAVSRITLADACDRFGMRLPRIDWRYSAADMHTVRGTLALIAGALESGGHGSLAWDPDSVADDMLRHGAYGGHHLGTARMAADPRHGVVDANCAVHGVSNLYVAGGAVFATSGQANPTLTILALALRLADHVAHRLATPDTAFVGAQGRARTPLPA